MRPRVALAAVLSLGAALGTQTLPLTPGEQKVAAGMGPGERRPGIPIDHDEQPYGFVYLAGSPTTQEFFRANFGGLMPCGSRQVAWMPDKFGCSRIDTPVVSSRFAVALRGSCTFATKAAYAQKAGAHGLIVVNNAPGLVRMPLGNRSVNEDNAIYLPSVMVRESFARILDRFAEAGRPLTAAMRPFREACTPDSEYAPHAIVRKKISPSSPEVIKRGGRSPFVLDTPPGDTDWEPETATGGRLVVGLGPDLRPVRIAPSTADAGAPGEAATPPEREIRAEFASAAFGGPLVDSATPLVRAEPAGACGNLTNAAEASGKIVVATRGVCPMIHKARSAQAAGAVGLLLVNNDVTPVLLDALTTAVGSDAATPDAGALTEDASAALAKAKPAPEAVGVVQAAPDNKPDDVHIGVAMVSAADGAAILGALGGDTAAAVHVRMDSQGGVPVGASWDDVRELLRAGGAFWPKGARDADRRMVQLLRQTDPRATKGDAVRYRALLAAALASGADRARRMVELAGEVGFDGSGGPLEHHTDLPAPVPTPTLSSSEAATAFLLRRLPADSIHLRKSDSLGCSIEGGAAHVRVPPINPDHSTGVSVTPRIADLLRYQACIEKLLLHNTAALGNMLRLLKDENKGGVYQPQVHGLFRRFGSPDQETSLGMAEDYIQAAKAVTRAPAEGQPSGGTVGSVLRAE